MPKPQDLSHDTSDELINPADFQSIELEISFENLTTSTAVKDGRRIYGEKGKKEKKTKEQLEQEERLSIRLVEFLDHGMVLEVPALSCAEGHRLQLSVTASGLQETRKYPGGLFTFQADVQVTSNEKLDRHRERISVELIDDDSVAWQTFLEIYAERQQQILEFFEAVKP